MQFNPIGSGTNTPSPNYPLSGGIAPTPVASVQINTTQTALSAFQAMASASSSSTHSFSNIITMPSFLPLSDIQELLITGHMNHLTQLHVVQFVCRFYKSRPSLKDKIENTVVFLESNGKNHQKTLIFEAARMGSMPLVKWYHDYLRYPIDDEDLFDAAAESGNIDLMQYLRDNDCRWSERTCVSAIKNGHRTALEWLHEKGCPWDADACTEAVERGDLNLFQWLRKEGCPVDSNTLASAAKGGHLEVLKVLINSPYSDKSEESEEKFQVSWSSKASFHAAANGRREILEFLDKENTLQLTTLIGAAARGDLELLEWLENNYELPRNQNFQALEAYVYAAQAGHLEILKWLTDHGFPVPIVPVITNAARHGHLHILEHYYVKGVSYIAEDFMDSSLQGHLHVLKWLHAKNVSLNPYVTYFAALGGHQHLLEYLNSIGYKWTAKTCVAAATGGHLNLLKWLRIQGCEWDAEFCQIAASKGNVALLKWLHTNGCPWDHQSCVAAVLGGHVRALKYLLKNDCPWNETALQLAQAYHPELLPLFAVTLGKVLRDNKRKASTLTENP